MTDVAFGKVIDEFKKVLKDCPTILVLSIIPNINS